MSAKSLPPNGLAEALPAPAPSQLPRAPPEVPAQESLEQMSDADLFQFAQAGETRAIDLLLARYLPTFLVFAESLCGDWAAAQDLCQAALPKAMWKLSKVTSAAAFVPWVKKFITNELKHFARKMKKSGTATFVPGIEMVEGGSVEATSHYAIDMKHLMELLRQKAGAMEGLCPKVAAFMIEYWDQWQEFPSIDAIMAATLASHGTAQRSLAAVRAAWQQMLLHSEFATLIRQFYSKARPDAPLCPPNLCAETIPSQSSSKKRPKHP